MKTIETIYGKAQVQNITNGIEIKIDGVVIAEVVGKSADEVNSLPVNEIEDLIESHIH